MPLLKQFETPFGSIRLTRERDGTLCYYQNGCFHSQARPDGTSVCAYVHVIHQLIRQKRARDVLIIGCGGGTLATMASRLSAGVTVVDINPVAFQIARDYFRMPEAVATVQQNGLTYVRRAACRTRPRFDALVIDVFDADNNVPRGFTTPGFLASARKLLRRGGLLILNVISKHDETPRADAIARNLATTGLPVCLYDWPAERDHNTLIVGGPVRGLQIPSGREPRWMQRGLRGVVQRTPG